jgi:nitrous oxide reductase accessory protein NosL
MGRELIPFGKEAEAREFLKDHKGRSLLRFADVTADIVRDID